MSEPSALERLASLFRGEICDEPDWFELIQTANDEFVAPALHRRLSGSGIAGRIDPEVLAYLELLGDANRDRNRRMWAIVCEVVEGFNVAGIVPTLIKGACDMALMLRPEDHTRMLIDIDLMIDPAEEPAAREVFDRLGYGVLDETEWDHSPGSFWRPGTVASVDLHRSLPTQIARLLSDEDLGGRMRMIERDGLQFRVPDDSMRFLINISHDMLHHTALASGATNLRYLLVLAEQVQDPEIDLDWSWLHEKRKDWRFRLAYDLQMGMLNHLLAIPVTVPERQDLAVRILHFRRLMKARNPRLGRLEWNLVRNGLSAARFAGIRLS